MTWAGVFIPVKKQSGESVENYVRWKIQKFAERLKPDKNGKTKYIVNPRCRNTIKEFETYHWKRKTRDDDPNPEKPDKKDDHIMDALGDLNVMYLHYYKEIKKNPWDGKMKGTYVPPSPDTEGGEVDQDEDFHTTLWKEYIT